METNAEELAKVSQPSLPALFWSFAGSALVDSAIDNMHRRCYTHEHEQ